MLVLLEIHKSSDQRIAMKIFNTFAISTATLVLCIATTASAQIVWLENFDGQEGKGITGGTPPVTNMTGITRWSVETTATLASNQNFFVKSNPTLGLVFEANNVESQVVWQTKEIDISTNAFVELTVDLSEVGTMVSANYIRTYYSVNGQAETLFYENGDLDGQFTSAQAKQEAVSGTNLVIIIKAANNTATKKHRFDNVTVTAHTPVSNQPPALAVSPSGTSKSVIADNPITFDLIASEEYMDRDDNITLKMITNPGGATFAETNGTTQLTGTFSWTPDTAGDYTAIFEASDKDGTNTVQVDIKVYPGKEIIWLEDFNDPTIDGKGAYGPSNTIDLAGVTYWTVDITNADLSTSTDYFKVKDEQFEARDLDGEAIWISTSIDISTYASVSVEVNINYTMGELESSDYIRTYYSINGGTETLFEENGDLTDDLITPPIVAKQGGLSGSTLSIIIRCLNGADKEKYYFDNIKVSTPIAQGMILIVR